MHEAIFQAIRDNAKQLAEAAQKLKDAIKENRDPNGSSINVSQAIPETDYSLSDIDVGIASLVSFVEALQSEEQGIIIPRSLLDNLSNAILNLKNQIDGTTNIFTNVTQSQGGIKSIDAGALIITAQNDTQHSLAKPIRKTFANLDAALAAWFQLRVILKSPRLGEFGRMLTGLSSQQSDLSRLVETNVKLSKTVKDEQKKIADILAQASDERSEVARLLNEAQNDRKTLSEYSAEATEKVASIRTTHQEASALQGSVTEYQANFSRFDEQLKAREEKFQAENAELESIHARLGAKEKEIKRLLAESEGMLRGATNAGLAASFSALQSKINSELRWARYSFYFSIFVLAVLSLPIAFYVFPGLQVLLKSLTGIDPNILTPKNTELHSTWDVMAQVAARALLLIPGIWLVRFTGSRHERLFRLREHYAYKYSVASSVEGFKRQAPDLEQGIAAATFFELTFNPATRMDANSSESRHPNPIMEWFMRKLGGAEVEKPTT